MSLVTHSWIGRGLIFMRLPLVWLLGVPQNIHILSSQMLTASASFQSWQAEKHPKVRRLSFLKAKALYPRFIIWKAFNKGQRCMGGLVDFRGRNDNQIGAKKEMQNGPTKINVTPENLARYLQLMQIQVNLKIDKTQANFLTKSDGLRAKDRILRKRLSDWKFKLKISKSLSLPNKNGDVKKSRLVTPEKVFRSRNHDVSHLPKAFLSFTLA